MNPCRVAFHADKIWFINIKSNFYIFMLQLNRELILDHKNALVAAALGKSDIGTGLAKEWLINKVYILTIRIYFKYWTLLILYLFIFLIFFHDFLTRYQYLHFVTLLTTSHAFFNIMFLKLFLAHHNNFPSRPITGSLWLISWKFDLWNCFLLPIVVSPIVVMLLLIVEKGV